MNKFKEFKNYVPVKSNIDMEIKHIYRDAVELRKLVNSESDAEFFWYGLIERLSFYTKTDSLCIEVKETINLAAETFDKITSELTAKGKLSNGYIDELIVRYFVLRSSDKALKYIKTNFNKLQNNYIITYLEVTNNEQK